MAIVFVTVNAMTLPFLPAKIVISCFDTKETKKDPLHHFSYVWQLKTFQLYYRIHIEQKEKALRLRQVKPAETKD